MTGVWSEERAAEWQAERGWRVGCNFAPSCASNQLEMWQAETFDPDTIDRELELAHGLGFNAVRVYLHDLLWQQDAGRVEGAVHGQLRAARARRGRRAGGSHQHGRVRDGLVVGELGLRSDAQSLGPRAHARRLLERQRRRGRGPGCPQYA